jgi:bifunctional enzyme CysN/CysC
MADAGLVVVVALISPLASDRAMARAVVGEGFREVYVKADLAACEARDPKGLYRKARRDAIREFTGISAPYQAPTAPDLEIDTTRLTVEEGVRLLLDHAEAAFVVGPAAAR